jgi:hypothetical protein
MALMVCFSGMAAGTVGLVHGQGFETWSKVESAEETRTYSQELGVGTFDAAQQGVLERIILPQLEKPANRPTIAQVRQRMREIITRGTTNPKIFDAANAIASDFMMSKLVANDSQDMVVRVNAMLLVGELVAADRKAWPGSIEALTKAAGDAKLPLAVRIAAMAGLVRQVNDGRGSDPAFAKAVGPVVTTIITAPPEGDPRAVAWLLGRSFDLVPGVGGTPAVLKAAATVLADEDADLDLRVRAAMALGRLVKPGAAPDLAAAVPQIRGLAITALTKDLDQAEAHRFAKQLSGGVNKGATVEAAGMMTPPPGQPMDPGGGGFLGGGFFGGEPPAGADAPIGAPSVVDPDAVLSLACRRNAWRLVSLADAIQPEASKGSGIASGLSGDAAAVALELATVLREQGLAIDTVPDEQSVKAALAALEGLATPAGAPEPGAPAETPSEQTEPQATPPSADSPFGGSSPF